jgi:hypothetical protein
MLDGCRRDEEIEGSSVDSTTSLPKTLAKPRATAGDRQRERHYWDGLQERGHLLLSTEWIRGPKDALVDLHIDDDADRDASIGKPVEKVHSLGDACEVVDGPVGVDKVGHLLAESPDAVLLALGSQILEQSLAVDLSQGTGAPA